MSRLRCAPARVRLAQLPTRAHRLSRLSDELGIELWVKRDDETGTDLSGNKVRKLEYLLAEAQAESADIVLTCGGIQSNHCRATALAARRLGMDSLLFLRGAEPEAWTGNLLLDRLVGAETRFITPAQYADRGALLASAAAELRAAGRRPYVIPEGGSNALGSWGYVGLLAELLDADSESASLPGGITSSVRPAPEGRSRADAGPTTSARVRVWLVAQTADVGRPRL
ncbi:MAG: pyridoxal-phosphate dependent enzyme [Candidatus Eisenbacteria bacterium]